MQIKREFGFILYSWLQEVQKNMAFQYHQEDILVKGDAVVLHVLDEVMQNINGWCKKLPMGKDKDLWRLHAPNIICTHEAQKLETKEYIKQRIDYDNEEGETKKTNLKSIVKPRKNLQICDQCFQ